MSTPFALGLGSNLGDSRAILADAVRQVRATPGLVVDAVSSLYRTAPVGGVDQPDFLNAVLVGSTVLTAADLLLRCQAVEASHRRRRDVRWGPRTLDIDVLFFGDDLNDDPVLTLPHPRAHERAFVLIPWAEIAPEGRLPGRGDAASLAAAVDPTGVERLVTSAWPPPSAEGTP